MAKASTQPAGGWLFKEEPQHYSFADLERDRDTVWDGVTNNLALKNLREVRTGDKVLFYQTGNDKAVVGEMRVMSDPYPDEKEKDPKLVVVDVRASKRWPRSVTLAEIKADPDFADWDLVKNSRLSVMRVSAKQWQRLVKLSQANP